MSRTTSAPRTPRTLSRHHPQIAAEIASIRHRLHGNTVTLLGSDLGRFAETGSYALRNGLHAVIQPRLFDHPQTEIMAQLGDAARLAERLRREHPKSGVTLAVGCEHILFTPGIVPGTDLFERAAYLEKHPEEWPAIVRRLNEFLGRQVELARRYCRGPLTYGAAAGLEQVDWRMFDVVGLDYYESHPTADGHRQALTPYRRWNKPIWILEFGCCTFEGADAGRLRGDQPVRRVGVHVRLPGRAALAPEEVRLRHRGVQPAEVGPDQPLRRGVAVLHPAEAVVRRRRPAQPGVLRRC